VIGAIIVVAAAFISPTIESLLISLLIAQVIRAALSYIITDYKNQFMFSKAIAIEVVTFGRWIFLSSMLAFLCASFDRLYLGKVAP
ncbi:oligosaccharide flippase family protein, partial [Bacillus cereus group sp. BC330]